jgi:hypothetical protein
LAVDLNQSIFAFFYRLLTLTPSNVNIFDLGYGTVTVIIYASIVGLSFFLLFLSKKSNSVRTSFLHNKENIEYSLLFIFMALFSPLGWVQNYSSAILAIMILVYYAFKTRLSKISPFGMGPQDRKPRAGKDKFAIFTLALFFVLVDLINFETVGRRLNDFSLYLSFMTWGIFLLIAWVSKLRLSKVA